jgi:hypothetical protein
MRDKIITGLLFFLLAISGYGQALQGDGIPLAPKQNRRPENFKPNNVDYSLVLAKENECSSIGRTFPNFNTNN